MSRQQQFSQPPGGGFSDRWIWPDTFVKSSDTPLTPNTHLASTTTVGFLPYTLPPRSRILRGFVSGDNLPVTAETVARMQFQFFNANLLDLVPTTMIGATTVVPILGAGALLSVASPPYFGLGTGTPVWKAPWAPTDNIYNESYTTPKAVYLGVQFEGGGVFTGASAAFHTILRPTQGPTLLALAAGAQSWAYTFVNSPAIAVQFSGALNGRPLVTFQLEGF